jgi:hypothetical protein
MLGNRRPSVPSPSSYTISKFLIGPLALPPLASVCCVILGRASRLAASRDAGVGMAPSVTTQAVASKPRCQARAQSHKDERTASYQSRKRFYHALAQTATMTRSGKKASRYEFGFTFLKLARMERHTYPRTGHYMSKFLVQFGV